jgi:signal transduction histidine kinase
MWRRQQWVWHALFGALLAVLVLIVVAEGGDAVALQLALVGALAVVYVVFGRRALARSGRPAAIYLTLAWSLFFGLVLADAQSEPWLLTFALFPQTWAMAPRRAAVAVVSVAVVVFAGIRIWQTEASGDALSGIFVGSLIMFITSIVLGLFITRIIDEADARAAALDELRRTQDQLAAAERAQGVAGERERISREIHDTLAQGFTSVVTLARATESALDRGDLDAVRARLQLIEQTASDNLSEARLIVAEMTPGHLQSRTLTEALQRLVDAVSLETGMSGRLRVEGEPLVLPANSEVVLLRSAQEGLANVRRHSGARSFEVFLSYAADGPVAMTVTDDGVGFAPEEGVRGYGLDGASARASEVGGRFEVESTPGSGARLRVEVPR